MDSPLNTLIFVIGAPGSGKGTLCKKLAAQYGFQHLSVGDLLHRLVSRSSASDIVTDYLQRGETLPGDILVPVLKAEIDELGDSRTTLLDGFPRRPDQMACFEETFRTPDLVLLFDCPEKTAEGRVLTRRVGREGDTQEIFRRRYKEFTELNPGVLRYYRDKGLLAKINTSGGIEHSYTDLVECLMDHGFHSMSDRPTGNT